MQILQQLEHLSLRASLLGQPLLELPLPLKDHRVVLEQLQAVKKVFIWLLLTETDENRDEHLVHKERFKPAGEYF